MWYVFGPGPVSMQVAKLCRNTSVRPGTSLLALGLLFLLRAVAFSAGHAQPPFLYTLPMSAWVTPEEFSGDDRTRIQLALNTGKNVMLTGTYDLGPSGSPVGDGYFTYLEVVGKHRQKIYGQQNATILFDTAPPAGYSSDFHVNVFRIRDSSFLEFNGFRVEDTKTDPYNQNNPRVGGIVFSIHGPRDAVPNEEACRNIAVRDVEAHHCFSVVRCGEGKPDKEINGKHVGHIEGVFLENIFSDRNRYFLQTLGNGHKITARGIRCYENVRDYSNWGCSDHDLQFWSFHPLANNGGVYGMALGAHVIDGKPHGCRRIRLRSHVEQRNLDGTPEGQGNEGELCSIGFSHIYGDPTRVMDLLDLEFTGLEEFENTLVVFNSTDASGDVESPTLNRFNRIKIRGDTARRCSAIRWDTCPIFSPQVDYKPW